MLLIGPLKRRNTSQSLLLVVSCGFMWFHFHFLPINPRSTRAAMCPPFGQHFPWHFPRSTV